MTTLYNLKNIRTLLAEGFTANTLRHFCLEYAEFRPVYDMIGENCNKTQILDCIIECADQKLRIGALLAWAKEQNPVMYQKYHPYDNGNRSILPKKGEGRLEPDRVRMLIHISDDLSGKHGSIVIAAFAALMEISPRDLSVTHIHHNSIVYDLGVPLEAAERIKRLLQEHNPQLRSLKIEKIVLENELGQTEEWVLDPGKREAWALSHLETFLDEILVALYLWPGTNSEDQQRIGDELKGRYYPHQIPQQMVRSSRGDRFNKRVYAVLRANKIRPDQVDRIWRKCADAVFEALFLTPDKFEKLLRDFDPTRAPSQGPFQFWVINVRLPKAVVDWLRKVELPQESASLDDVPVEAPSSFREEGVAAEYPGSEPWLWWDALLIPKHGLIIRLFHLAYIDLPRSYVVYLAKVYNKTIDQAQTAVNLLQQRLRPARRFGHSEQMQIYMLEKLLEAEALKVPDGEAKLDETRLKAVISDAIEWTNWKYPDQPPIEAGVIIELLVEALAGFPLSVAEVRKVMSRWRDFLAGQLIESQLEAVRAEIARWEAVSKEQQIYLDYIGQDSRVLSEAAIGLTLQELMQHRQAMAAEWDDNKAQTLVYQERVLRFDKARRKQARLLADYAAGKDMITPRQYELAEVLGLTMGSMGARIAQAKRALNGAIIWRDVLKEIADLALVIDQRSWLAHVDKACIVTFEQTMLRLGYPANEPLSWWDELRSQVAMLLQRPTLRNMLERYGQTGMVTSVVHYQDDWPPLKPVWADETASWVWRIRQ